MFELHGFYLRVLRIDRLLPAYGITRWLRMTAEIVVANKWGLAIAADSAVTVEQFHNGRLSQKVYNSANKLFMLSKHEPVGVMIYNATTVGGVPWETIIKSIRKDIGTNSHANLSDYASFFFDTLDQDKKLLPEDSVRSIIRMNAFRIIHDLSKNGESKKDFLASLENQIAELEKTDFIEGWDEEFLKSVVKTYNLEIRAISKIATSSPSHVTGCAKKIDRLIGLSFTKKARLRGYSGIVFCGFGREDMFPKVIHYYTDIVVCGRARHWIVESTGVTGDSGSLVMPFADTNVIRTIMEGINPNFRSELVRELVNILTGIPKELFAPVAELQDSKKKAYIDAAGPALVGALSAFFKSINEIRDSNYMGPIQQTIQVLPVSELAMVAETLISASQIHKRMNPDVESVGGPIDVAVISKGDGFIWIKRKHYFDPKLNPGFVTRYLDS